MNFKTALSVLAASSAMACASTSSTAVTLKKEVPLGQANLDNELQSRPLSAYCSRDEQALEGRGSAGGLGWGAAQQITAGGYVVNVMLQRLSPELAMEEGEAIERKIQDVLEYENDGRTIEWTSPTTNQAVIMRPRGTKSSFRLITIPRAEEVGRTPESYAADRGTFVTKSNAPLRPSPTISGNVEIEKIPAGHSLEVMGRVRGLYSENWYMVGNHGVAYGYMEPKDLRPLGSEQAPIYAKTTGQRVKDPVSATLECRDMTVTTKLGEDSFTACREPGGRWVVDTQPGVRPGEVAACVPLYRPRIL